MKIEPNKRYCFIGDQSGHDYLCPLDRVEEAEKMIAAVEAYWDNMDRDDLEGGCPEEPDFIERIDGGPWNYSFENPKEL